LATITFRKIDLFPYSGEIMAAPIYLLGPLERASSVIGSAIILTEDGNRSTFRNVLFLRNIKGWTKSKNMILSRAVHKCQNPLEPIRTQLYDEIYSAELMCCVTGNVAESLNITFQEKQLCNKLYPRGRTSQNNIFTHSITTRLCHMLMLKSSTC
jgi:hypothetical protein